MTHKFFMKRFKHFSIIMLIPTLLIMSVFIILLSFVNIRTVKQESTNALSVFQESLDLAVSATLVQCKLMTLNSNFQISLQKLLRNYDLSYDELTFFNISKTVLHSITDSHSYIDSIYFYLDGYDLYFSSVTGLSDFNGNYDYDWYNAYLSMPASENLYILPRTIPKTVHTTQDIPVITIFERMTITRGVILVNINTAMLSDTLDTITGNSGVQLFLLNPDGDALISSDTVLSSTLSAKLNKLTREIEEEQQLLLTEKWLVTSDGIYMCSIMPATDHYAYLCALVPLSVLLRMLLPHLLLFVLFLIVNLLITFTLSYMTTKRIFNQISYIIQVFADAEKGISPTRRNTGLNDEYDIILDNIINLFLRNTVLKSQVAEQKYKRQVNELIALQLQINPHFLLNTLQTIHFKSVQIMGGTTVVNTMIENLSDILKYSLVSDESLVLVNEELSYLKKYVKIQQIRFDNRFYVYYETDESCLYRRLPRLLLQPLIENSILHGLRPSSEGIGYIRIKIQEKGEKLVVTVTDTGVGMSRERIKVVYAQINDESSRNIGLTNVNRRLLLYFGKDAGLHIRSKEGMGTSIFFTIPSGDIINCSLS